MACNCSNITTLNFSIELISSNKYVVKNASGATVANCGSNLVVPITVTDVCAKLIFTSDSELQPLEVAGTCPCAVTEAKDDDKYVYTGTFERATASYEWELPPTKPQPPCKIVIVIQPT
jgi:hypothetical protein